MSRKPRPTLAERCRAHRALFETALAMNCTPAEAKAELALRAAEEERRAARARWEASQARLQAKQRGNAPPLTNQPPAHPAPPPWMMAD